MADEAPVSQVLCEASEYLSKLGTNLRLRSENLKEKRISKEKLRNAHAVQKAANKMLLICELSKKSLENVENGIRKVLSIVSSSQALTASGGKPEKSKELDRSLYHFFEYDSFKLRVPKKIPFRHYMSVKVLASRMSEAMIQKYPVYHRCKLYKKRRAARKSIENKVKLDIREKGNNSRRSNSVDNSANVRKNSISENNKDTQILLSDTNDEDGFKGFSPIGNTNQDSSNLNKVTKSRSPSPDKNSPNKNDGNMSENSDSKNLHHAKSKQSKKFRRIHLIDDDMSNSSKEDLSANEVAKEKKSEDENCPDTNLVHEDTYKSKTQKHSSNSSQEDLSANEVAKEKKSEDENCPDTNLVHEDTYKSKTQKHSSNSSQEDLSANEVAKEKKSKDKNCPDTSLVHEDTYKSKTQKHPENSPNKETSDNESNKIQEVEDVPSKYDDSTVSGILENKLKESGDRCDTINSKSVETNDNPSIDKDDEVSNPRSTNETNKPLLKCVSITKLLKPEIATKHSSTSDKKLNSRDKTKAFHSSKLLRTYLNETEMDYWDNKRAEVKKFKAKEFSINISRLPQFNDKFLNSHNLKKITRNNAILCEISKVASSSIDNSNLKDAKNSLLNDSDSDNVDSNEFTNKKNHSKNVKQSLLAESDSEKSEKSFEIDKSNNGKTKSKENEELTEGETSGQRKELISNKDDHHNEKEEDMPSENHDNNVMETESTSKLVEDNQNKDCHEKLPGSSSSSDTKAPIGKRKSLSESLNAKKMLLSSDSEVEDSHLKSKIDGIKNSLLNNVSSSEDEKRKQERDDDSPRKKLLASSGTDDEEENKRTKQRKKLKSRKKRKALDSDKDSSSIEEVDGSVDSVSKKQKKKMGRSKAKPGSSNSSDTQDNKDVKGLTNLTSLRNKQRRRISSSSNSTKSETMKSTRSTRNMPSVPKIKDENALALESSSDAADDDNGDVEDLPPVSMSGLNGGAIDHLAKDDLLNESDSSSADKEKSEGSKKDETIDSDEEASMKLKRRKGQTISSDSEVGSSRKKDRGGKLSDFEDSEDESSEYSKKTKRRKKAGSDSDASGDSDLSKKKRRRIKQVDDSDLSGSDTENEGKNKHGRKNIRKVMGKNQLEEATKKAARQEKERIARIAERQKLYNNMQFDESGKPDEVVLDKVVLDFDPETKEPLIEVDRGLVKKLKPHQANGIKFMWDACFESVKRIKKDKGSGCILAHCMGLGKTLQVVSLTHTLLTQPELTGVNRVLVVCPLSTVLNWVNEFNMWLKYAVTDTDVHVYELSRFKQNSERAYQLTQWFNNGGVCVLGYEMFRNLSADNNKKYKKKMLRQFQESLVDPGPDMVVCDEGHLLKNEKTSLSQSMNKVRTLRRIVLTGTPLQNNLKEYYCMVQFVKPNLLGKYNEYLNRFVNPITNGQYTDSTEHDIRIMKRRSHVLHKMLDGAVQRRDYGVLAPFLPPKHENVLFITLTDVQIKLYQYYLDNYSRRPLAGKSSGFLFPDFQSLQRIWTHPLVLKYNSERYEIMQQKKRDKEEEDSEGSLVDFIDDDSTPDESSSEESSDDLSDMSDDSRKKSKKKKSAKKSKAKESKASTRRGTRANPELIDDDTPEVLEVKNENPTEWWVKLVTDDELEDMRNSSKLVLLFDILRQCETIGDKLLVFSQSLYSLDLIEHFLGKVDEATQEGREDPKLGGHLGSWSPGVDYFRLDGSTSCENRSIWCKNFNREDNPRARLFLISTRAGGLGINLVAANRVVIFDVSWNPSHDVQSIFRVYRFGQKKPCYIYRFLAMGTMEEKIYERQVTKQAISKRVIDEQQIDRHYAENDLAELYKFEASPPTPRPIPPLPKDRLFAEMLKEHESRIYKYHEHDSLLENKEEETLTEEERKAAWEDFENEKNRPPPAPFPAWPMHNGMVPGLLAQQQQQLAYAALAAMLRKDMPTINEQQIRDMLPLIYNSNPQLMQKMSEIYKYTQQPGMMNPMMNPVMNPGSGSGGSSGLQYSPPWQRQQQQQQQLRLQQMQQHQNSMGAKFYAGGLGSRDPIAMALQQQRAREIMVGDRAPPTGAGRPRGRPPHQPRPTVANDVVNLADSD